MECRSFPGSFSDFLQSFPWFVSQAVDPWVGVECLQLCTRFGSPPLWGTVKLVTKLQVKSPGKVSPHGLRFHICGLLSEHSRPPLLVHSLSARASHPEPLRASQICATNPFFY